MYLSAAAFLKAVSMIMEGECLPGTDIQLYRKPEDGLQYRLKATVQSIMDSHSTNIAFGLLSTDGYRTFVYRSCEIRSGREWLVAGKIDERLTMSKDVVIVSKSRRSDEITAFGLDRSCKIADAIVRGIAWSIGTSYSAPLANGTVATHRKAGYIEFEVELGRVQFSGGYVPGDWVQHWLTIRFEDFEPVRKAIATQINTFRVQHPVIDLGALGSPERATMPL